MHRHFLGLGILLAALFVANVAVFAWQEPSQPPPKGNVSTPLNIGNVGQSKVGGLILNTGGAQLGLLIQQGNVGVGTTSPASSALLDLSSTSQGLLLPRMSTAQRDAVVNPVAGLQIFNTTTAKMNYFDGNQWRDVVAGEILDCLDAGGSWHRGQGICYFYSSSCPSGWSKEANWSSTTRNTCTASLGASGDSFCTTGSHTRANRTRETCQYTHAHIFRGGSRYYHQHTCYATITETGCVKN